MGIFLSSHMETVKRILPEEEITRAVLIFAVCSNLYVALGDLLAPFVYTNLSFNALYFILSGIQVLGVGVLFFFLKKPDFPKSVLPISNSTERRCS